MGVERVEQHAARRGHGVILAIGSAGERARRAHEGPRDHPTHLIRPTQKRARGFADFIQLPERDDFFVRGHLEDAVGGSVDDGRAGAHVLRAQLFDDFRAGGGLIAQRAAGDAALELVHDFARESMRVERERLVQVDARHFPMAGGGVLAGRGQGAAAERSGRLGGGRQSGQRFDVAEAQAAQVGQAQRALARDVAERVAAGIAVRGGVGHLADADAVKHDPDYPLKHRILTVTRGSGTARFDAETRRRGDAEETHRCLDLRVSASPRRDFGVRIRGGSSCLWWACLSPTIGEWME